MGDVAGTRRAGSALPQSSDASDWDRSGSPDLFTREMNRTKTIKWNRTLPETAALEALFATALEAAVDGHPSRTVSTGMERSISTGGVSVVT